MTADLQALIDRGSSRPDQQSQNDGQVEFKTTQKLRWAPVKD
jgi:hypothetical protein